MGAEEQNFQKTHQEMRQNMINHCKDWDKKGFLNRFERAFLKQGVMFKPIKYDVFGMRVDEIQEREMYIK